MLLTVAVFILVLSILVFVHELGHFWAARKFGARVEEFGFGLPPRMFGVYKENGRWKFVGRNLPPRRSVDKKKCLKGEEVVEVEEKLSTIYSLNWIPVGGFVKIKGEDGQDRKDEDSFGNKPAWQRLIMLSSGVVMNFLLCVALLIIVFGLGVPASIDGDLTGAVVSDPQIQIIQVMEDMPAQQAGVMAGDVIVAVDDQAVEQVKDLNDYLINKEGQEIKLVLRRGNEEIVKNVKTVAYRDVVGFGVGVAETVVVKYPWHLAVWQGIKASFIWLADIIIAFLTIIKNLIFGAPIGVEVAGPVGIAVMTGQAAKMGLAYILQFTALLSLNLAVINFFPFPALDGGRVLFLIIEKIRGKAVKQKWENLTHNIGFLFLMLLIVLVTYRDVVKYGGRAWMSLMRLMGL